MSDEIDIPVCFGELQLLDDVNASASFQEMATVLPLVMQRHPGAKRLCWASTAASVAAFKNRGDWTTPCEVASLCLGQFDCCPGGTVSAFCDRDYALHTALDRVGCLASPPKSGPLPLGEVIQEIRQGRPVCCHISWTGLGAGNNGHFNVIVGYGIGSSDVVVRDSAYPDDFIGPYDQFKDRYRGNGKWDCSYLTR